MSGGHAVEGTIRGGRSSISSRGKLCADSSSSTQVVPQSDLLETAVGLARKIASRGPVAVRLATDAVLRGFGGSLEEGLHLERDLFGLVFATDDMQEGTQAFLEKRKAAFRGT